jgi:hypothetical protein
MQEDHNTSNARAMRYQIKAGATWAPADINIIAASSRGCGDVNYFFIVPG